MKILNGVIVPAHPCMREPMRAVDHIYREFGERHGFTMTAGAESTSNHSAGSWHYCAGGCAFDVRIYMFDTETVEKVFAAIKARLPGYDVILHKLAQPLEHRIYSHIHIEPGDELARKWGLMLEP